MSPPSVPPPSRARRLSAFALGLLLGILCHYLLYRLSLPSQPFIYVSF